MENHSSKETIKVVGALLVGAAIGAGLGILFAPDKGSETRRKIMRKGKDVTDELTDKFNDFLDEIKEQYETGKEEAKDFVNHK